AAMQRERKDAVGMLGVRVVLVDYPLKQRRVDFGTGVNACISFRIELDNAREDEPAFRYCDPADLLEQFTALPDAHNRAVDAAQHGVDAVQPPYSLVCQLALSDVYAHPDQVGLLGKLDPLPGENVRCAGSVFGYIAGFNDSVAGPKDLPDLLRDQVLVGAGKQVCRIQSGNFSG